MGTPRDQQHSPQTSTLTAVDALRSLFPVRRAPCVGIILGTGLGQWAESLTEPASIAYEDIPGFPRSTVQSHAGFVRYGMVGAQSVLVLQGRFHLYEGYTPEQVCFGVRTLALLGIKQLIITNAAGALNPLFHPGEIMAVCDQINLTGCNPLLGLKWGEPLFPDMSQLFSPRLRDLAHAVAADCGLRLQEGVYVGILGPSLETPAETRAYRMLGGDAIGMSTVMETIAARQMGMELLGLSCLTNKNLPDCMAPTCLEEIIAVGQAMAPQLSRLLSALVASMPSHA
ncbi:MAG TPA: purine-nucleoside phosphorylase [Desulfonatronum sp.]|nr:purine-nucleoside phosphorylase [Desulfonatronum sp.]